MTITDFQPTRSALPPGGPHWHDCERKHTACAHELGRRQALHEAAEEIAGLAHPDDPPARTVALHEAHAIVRRLAGLPPLTYPGREDTPMPDIPDFAARLAEIRAVQEAEEADREEEELDLAALHGACADEADSPC